MRRMKEEGSHPERCQSRNSHNKKEEGKRRF